MLHTVSSITTPIPSNVNIAISFQRNRNEILIDNRGTDKEAKFRIFIENLLEINL